MDLLRTFLKAFLSLQCHEIDSATLDHSIVRLLDDMSTEQKYYGYLGTNVLTL